ncbi:MAG: DegQ family serine endoprotease [Rhodospirillaceae bacterium]|nr:DegQ family serine endoprotease [Rhodospirillaceae bacterium]
MRLLPLRFSPLRFARPLSVLAAVLAALVPIPASAQEPVVPRTREQVSLTFAPVVKRASPAVVNIYTKRVVQQRVSPLFNDPFFRQFFGPQFEQQFGGGQRERIENSLGSGVIVRANGVVLTNNHVVANADEIRVVMSDRREFEATIVGKDERTDLAVLRMKLTNETLPALELADSDAIEVGDLVLAIGNPFGVGQTVTSGIVSALARTNLGLADVQSFIQTDAAINPGNSGGALITSDGRLIGINTAIFSQSGGSIGIGFAIPANLARNVLSSILTEGKVVRPWIGASGATLDKDLAKTLGIPRPGGIVVQRIVPGSPVARAGLAVGDVILSMNGKDVFDQEEFRFLQASIPLGQTASLVVNRAGEQKTISVRLEAAPETPARQKTTLSGRQPFAGSTVANLNPALADELKVEYTQDVVLILQVAAGTVSARIGFQPGDRIIALNDVDIKSVDDLTKVVAKPSDVWAITISRNGQVLKTTIGD